MVLKRLGKLWKGKDKKGIIKGGASEQREFIRLLYPPTKRPKFKFGEHELEVIDISESGLKLLNDKEIKLGQLISGEIVLLSGKSINLTGEITWEHSNEVGLLITLIPRSIILEEERALSKA